MRLRETRTTDPVKEAVDLQQAKAYLRLSDSDVADDALIAGLIRVATEACENYTGRALITQTWTAFMDSWPRFNSDDAYWEGVRTGPENILLKPMGAIELNHSPLQAVSSITTYDDSDTATTYSTASYFVDTDSKPGRIVLRTSAAAPITTRVANGIRIIYVAGYGDNPDDVPESLRQSTLGYVSHLYEHRGDEEKMAAIPTDVMMQWAAYQVKKLWS